VRLRISAIRFVAWFGLVSALGDVVYEGARSIIGPLFATFGASAATIGLITGIGEAVALVLRLVTGPFSDRTGRPWPQTIVGYGLTMVCVPLIALTGSLAPAALLYNGERFGKAVRTPSRDTMLAHASAVVGVGRTFGLHEALDQSGALAGPLLLALVLGAGGSLKQCLAILAVPGAVAMIVLVRLRLAAPHPEDYDPQAVVSDAKKLTLDTRLPRQFWLYSAFSAATMLGFSTWAVLAYHLVHKDVVHEGAVPVLYAGAMGAAAVAALLFGRIYDRQGFRGLVALPVLAAVVPVLSFSTNVAAVSVGALVWGVAMGVHDSTMRAAVTDLVPRSRRGAGYGVFTAIYGIAWLVGAAVIGVLYDHGVALTETFVVAVQVVALGLLVPVLREHART
jgi:MFS family permease